MATQSRSDSIDEMVDDSFPASDPPSFTPITGTGSRESAAGGDSRERDAAAVGQTDPKFALWVAVVGAGAATVAMVIRRKRRTRRGPIARAVDPVREFVHRAVPS